MESEEWPQGPGNVGLADVPSPLACPVACFVVSGLAQGRSRAPYEYKWVSPSPRKARRPGRTGGAPGVRGAARSTASLLRLFSRD